MNVGHTELLELAALATPGKWISDRDSMFNADRQDNPDVSLWTVRPEVQHTEDPNFMCNIAFDVEHPKDSEFIAAAVNYIRSPEFASLVKDAEAWRDLEQFNRSMAEAHMLNDAAIDAELKP